jgi:hypothetical protein
MFLPLTKRDLSARHGRIDNFDVAKQWSVVHENPHHRAGRENERLTTLRFLRRPLLRTYADKRHAVVVLGKMNPRRLTKLHVLKRRKFDDQSFLSNGRELT